MKREKIYKMIAKEWDEIADERYEDLFNGLDKSYNNILKPNLLKTIKKCDLSNVLDLGCGVGIFTEVLAENSQKVVGLDISEMSIELAKKKSTKSNIIYKALNYLDYETELKFTTIVANMSLMSMPNINLIFKKIKQHLDSKGNLVFIIPHPSFWPIYWKYNDNSFNYMEEQEIVKEFRIQNKIYKNHFTRHYHRPISYYFKIIIDSGLKITIFEELEDKNDNLWYPRFLLIKCSNL